MTNEHHFPADVSSGESLITVSTPVPDHPTLFLMTLHNGVENRFTFEMVDAINQALDYIDTVMDSLPDSKANIGGALITTGRGKFYSNGLNMKIIQTQFQEFNPRYYKLIARVLMFRLPTVAALNGHAFAGGCMFALAHDYRIMREDRGYICMNEVDIPLGLPPAMAAIVKCKINEPTSLRQCVLEGRRFTANVALKLGIVDKTAPLDQVIPTAIEAAKAASVKAKLRGLVLHQLKAEIYRETIIKLLTGEPLPASYLSKL
ncbi:hypothetical protein EV182_005591 [Spiromyces aspiralis]|uniref:Uncharacterized protein n=1 Tax=Spiromyces aspiralis TaxID=68401 RepID=A0ACC1HQU8_9FUNG|nr:hypothetical protein EV182_005591 [Spiromyces aspiralis]